MARPKKTPSDLQPKMDLICAALEIGVGRKDAALCAGVPYDTFHRWTTVYAIFAMQVEQSEAKCAAVMAGRIFEEATKQGGDYKAALEWLKRRRREEWADNVHVAVGKMTDAELIAFVAGGIIPADAGGNAGDGEEGVKTS